MIGIGMWFAKFGQGITLGCNSRRDRVLQTTGCDPNDHLSLVNEQDDGLLCNPEDKARSELAG